MLAPSDTDADDRPTVPDSRTAERRSRWRARTRRDESGIAIVEAAIVSIVFFTVLVGILEFGLAFRDYLTTANITRSGARAASGQGNDSLADYQILQSVKKASSGIGNGTIDYIVVFKATSYNSTLASVSTTCEAGTSVSGVCNVYTTADWARPSTDFGCDNAAEPDFNWCPTTRKIAASSGSGGPPDYVGVYVKMTHRNIFKLFAKTFVFKDQTIIRIEPKQP
jgi:Flp pilus assembly protein TadG